MKPVKSEPNIWTSRRRFQKLMLSPHRSGRTNRFGLTRWTKTTTPRLIFPRLRRRWTNWSSVRRPKWREDAVLTHWVADNIRYQVSRWVKAKVTRFTTEERITPDRCGVCAISLAHWLHSSVWQDSKSSRQWPWPAVASSIGGPFQPLRLRRQTLQRHLYAAWSDVGSLLPWIVE